MLQHRQWGFARSHLIFLDRHAHKPACRASALTLGGPGEDAGRVVHSMETPYDRGHFQESHIAHSQKPWHTIPLREAKGIVQVVIHVNE